MSPEPALLRLARPDELALLVEIDDDAGQLYGEAGLPIELEPEHPFLAAEQARWRSALEERRVFLAVDAQDRGLGFAALGTLGAPGSEEGAPYLEQLSVRRAAMGRGIGRRLLRRAIARAEAHDASAPDGWLWLTTYGHLRWNRPFYESEGFAVVAEAEWPAAIAHRVDEQRACLPDPEQRIAMRRPLQGRGRLTTKRAPSRARTAPSSE
jgi:GNAT superfamily N-acetyltransferase